MSSSKLAVAAVAVLLLIAFVPLAQVARADVEGWYSIYWDTSVWNSRYPGNNIYVDFTLTDTGVEGAMGSGYYATANYTLTSYKLVTPWQNYTATDVPASLCSGCQYYHEFDVTIPTTQPVGYVNFTVYFTGTYDGGSAFCAGTGNVCTGVVGLQIDPNPYTLLAQVATLNANVASLTSQVTTLQTQLSSANANISSLQSQAAAYQTQLASLQSQLTAANGTISSLQSQLTTSQGTVTSLQGQLSTANANNTALQGSLTTAQGQLQQAQATISADSGQLASLQSQLSAAQADASSAHSTLSTYENLYLPIAAAIPSLIAVVLAALLVRKRSAPKP